MAKSFKNTKKTISMAEAVKNLEKNPQVQKMLAELKAKRDASPARHARQYNLELMNIGMELNGRCQIISTCTTCILDNTYSMDERSKFYERRREELLIVAKLQTRHDELTAELDQAIVDEDALKQNA